MKYFGLGVAALVMTIGASASTLNVNCSVVGTNGATSFSGTALVCDQITAGELGGATLNSVSISISDSFNQGIPNQTNTFDFNYSAIDPDIQLNSSSATTSCAVTGVGTGATCQDIVTGTAGSPTFDTSGGNFFAFGNVITTDLGAYMGSGVFDIATVEANIDAGAPGSALSGSGQLGATAFVTFNYSFPASTPEPGSMILLGSGLLAAGLIGRKKLVRK
jgi:hypothetical protein